MRTNPTIANPIAQRRLAGDNARLVEFTVGKLHLALAIDAVEKVIKMTEVYGSGLNEMGVTTVDDREITVIDLHQRLFHQTQAQPVNTEQSYLILIKNSRGEEFAIVVNGTPSLLEIELTRIKLLPESYRKADTLAIASHVALLPPEGNHQETIFIIDPDTLL
jgi:purine-binding chemotaxis protein CheW